jgi:hypothetical protein
LDVKNTMQSKHYSKVSFCSILMKYFPAKVITYICCFRWLFKKKLSTDFKYSLFRHKLKLFVCKGTIIALCFWRPKLNLVFNSWTLKFLDYKNLTSVIFFGYKFRIKPHFFKPLFQSQFLFDFDDIFTNEGRIKCSVTM